MIESVSNSLLSTPGWSSMTAYDRAKQCCAEITRTGEAIPSWTVIRDIIGKGSAGDINRAKRDFRAEHGAALRKMEGFEAQGVPESLTPHIVGFWQAAIEHVRREFSEKEQSWQEEIEQATAVAELAHDERERALAEVQALHAKSQGLEASIETLRSQVASEQGARAQAEQMAADTRADLIGQRDRLDHALARTQEDLNKAITRLEGTERHMKMEIERVRQEAAQKQAAISAQLEKEQGKYLLDTTRLDKELQELRARTKSIQELNTKLLAESKGNLDRALRAEQLVNTLQDQNKKLLASVSRPTSRAKPKTIRKRLVGKRHTTRPQAHQKGEEN